MNAQIDSLAAISATISIIVSILGLLFGYLKYGREQEKRLTTLETKTPQAEEFMHRLERETEKFANLLVGQGEKIIALETKMEVFWRAVEMSVIDMVKHPTAKIKDELLDKLRDKTINIKELEELKQLLTCDVHTKRVSGLAAALLVGRIDMLLYDSAQLAAKH